MRLALETPIPTHNSITFDLTDPGAFDQIVANFDFRMTPGVGRADGLGFALLNTSPHGTTRPVPPEAPLFAGEEPNFERSLGMGFDIHQATGQSDEINNDVNNNHLSVHFFGIEQAEFDVTEVIDLAGAQWIHARVILRPGGGYGQSSQQTQGRQWRCKEPCQVHRAPPYSADPVWPL